jgi:hypothetical protein
LEGLYDIGRSWQIGAKLAAKSGEMRADRDAGAWTRTRVSLAVARLRYSLNERWDGIAEYRVLRVREAEDARSGALLGVSRRLHENLRLGAGYNFTSFSDDLTSLDYKARGWFLNLVGSL